MGAARPDLYAPFLFLSYQVLYGVFSNGEI